MCYWAWMSTRLTLSMFTLPIRILSGEFFSLAWSSSFHYDNIIGGDPNARQTDTFFSEYSYYMLLIK